MGEDIQRFWDKVDVGNENDCWNWTGALRNGYGAIKYNGKTLSAHRFSYEIKYGKPKNLVLHKCNNKMCVNPSHLYDGTHKDNARDAIMCGAMHIIDCTTYRFQNGHIPSNRKLSLNDISNIFDLKKNKLSNRRIGKIVGIDHTTVSRIINGKLYKNLTKEFINL